MMRVIGHQTGFEVIVESERGELVRRMLTADELQRLQDHLPADENDAEQVAAAVRAVHATRN